MLDPTLLTSDLLADYALGLLSPEQSAEVEAALERHPEARAELERYLGGLTDMVMELGPSEVPAGAQDRLLARLNAELPQDQGAAPVSSPAPAAVATERPPPSANQSRTWLYALLALAAAVVIGFAVLPDRGQNDFARYRAQAGAVTTTIRDSAGAAVADVVRLTDGHAYVQMRTGVPAGRTYQAWKIVGGKPVSLGLFNGQEFGAPLPAGTVFAVSVEPAGGSAQPTTAPLFAQPI